MDREQAWVTGGHRDEHIGVECCDGGDLVGQRWSCWVVTNREVFGNHVWVLLSVGLKAHFVSKTEVVVHNQASDLYRELVSEVYLDPCAPKNSFS